MRLVLALCLVAGCYRDDFESFRDAIWEDHGINSPTTELAASLEEGGFEKMKPDGHVDQRGECYGKSKALPLDAERRYVCFESNDLGKTTYLQVFRLFDRSIESETE